MTEKRWLQLCGIGGILFVAMLSARPSGYRCPRQPARAFDAPAKDWLGYGQAIHGMALPGYLAILAMFGFALFAAGLSVLRMADDRARIPSIVVALAAVVATAPPASSVVILRSGSKIGR